MQKDRQACSELDGILIADFEYAACVGVDLIVGGGGVSFLSRNGTESGATQVVPKRKYVSYSSGWVSLRVPGQDSSGLHEELTEMKQNEHEKQSWRSCEPLKPPPPNLRYLGTRLSRCYSGS